MELTPEDYAAWRLSLADEELFGKNDDDFEFRLPSDLKAALAKKAAERGTSTAALLRLIAVTYLYGADHVGILVLKRFGVVPGTAPESARPDARTTAPGVN
ncbi:ribbon-helix-helix protein, CopG family [Roseateles sp.]|uniref:ribbon-helix-helix protein, CopG family n=1 Tax=Roseateles sp. TaxID=1971397 RepID=UPI002ED7E0B3